MNSLFKTGFWTGSAWKRAAEDAKVRAIEGAVRALRTALSNEEEAMDIVDGDDGDEDGGWQRKVKLRLISLPVWLGSFRSPDRRRHSQSNLLDCMCESLSF